MTLLDPLFGGKNASYWAELAPRSHARRDVLHVTMLEAVRRLRRPAYDVNLESGCVVNPSEPASEMSRESFSVR